MKLLNHITKPVLLMMLFACSAYGNGWMWIKSYPWVYSDSASSWLYIASDGTPSVYNNDTWDTKTSSYFSELGWVWMKDANFGYSHKDEKWIYISNHDENSTFFFDLNSSSWLSWKNFSKLEITHLQLSDDDLKPNQYSSSNTLNLNSITGSKQDFSLVQDYPRLRSIKYLGHTFSPINNSYLSKLTSLEISFAKKSWMMDDIGPDVADLSAISDLTNIEWLVLTGAYEPTITLGGGEANLYGGLISDLSPLSNLTNLTYLEISGANVTNFSPLSNLPKLSSLTISLESNTDTSPLSGLTNLTSLSIEQATNLTDISSLKDLPNLTSLSITGATSLTDISPLSGLTNLTSLSIEQATNLTDISSLKDLPNLTSLSITDATSLSDTSSLNRLANLRSLKISGPSKISLNGLTTLSYLKLAGKMGFNGYLIELELTDLESLYSIENLVATNLTKLSLSGLPLRTLEIPISSISEIHLSDLPNFTSLEAVLAALSHLSISGVDKLEHLRFSVSENLVDLGSLTDFQALSKLTNLTSLSITGATSLADISPLSGLTNLTSLHIGEATNLIDISTLSSLTNLTSLSIYHATSLTDISGLEGLTNLTSLDLRESSLTESQIDLLKSKLPNTEITF